MKKLTLILALGAMFAITGCSKDEAVQNESQNANAITFNSEIANAETKGIEIPAGLLKHNFGVYAGKSTSPSSYNSNMMLDVQIKYANNKYTYDNPVYWPSNNTEKVYFCAYYPYLKIGETKSENVTSVSSSPTGYPFVNFKVSEDCEKQEDFVVAKTGGLSSGRVDLAFKHALTKIGFKAKLKENYDDVSVKITKIKISKPLNSGKYEFKTMSWDMNKTTSEYVLTNSNNPCHLKNNQYNDFDCKLLLMPQETKDLKIEVTYHMCDKNGVQFGETCVKTFSLGKKDWCENDCIIYQLSFSVDAIEFGTCVYDWDKCEFITLGDSSTGGHRDDA